MRHIIFPALCALALAGCGKPGPQARVIHMGRVVQVGVDGRACIARISTTGGTEGVRLVIVDKELNGSGDRREFRACQISKAGDVIPFEYTGEGGIKVLWKTAG